MPTERKLAAILSADVVGYSRLMAEDEAGAASDRRARRDPVRSALVLVMATAILLGIGPCSVIPGGRLNGEVAAELPEDWSFVNELGTCALETRPADPHSVTVLCYSNAGTLYVGSMAAAVKRWPKYVLEDPRVRYRAGERIYELRATLVESEDERRAAFRARHRLNGEEPAADVEVPDNYWIFRLEARESAE